MLSKLLTLVLLISFNASSFAFFESNRQLKFLDSSFHFDYIDIGNDFNNRKVFAQGIWKLKNLKDSLTPHEVKITCCNRSKQCNKFEAYVTSDDKYSFIISDTVTFDITHSSDTKIIAEYADDMVISTLIINTKDKKVNIISKALDKNWERYEGTLGGYAPTGELVDGGNLYIDIGDNKMVWSKESIKLNEDVKNLKLK